MRRSARYLLLFFFLFVVSQIFSIVEASNPAVPDSLAEGLTPVILGHMAKSEIAQADSASGRQLQIRKGLLGEEHQDVSESLGYLAYLAWCKGDYTGAGSFAHEA